MLMRDYKLLWVALSNELLYRVLLPAHNHRTTLLAKRILHLDIILLWWVYNGVFFNSSLRVLGMQL